MTRKIIFPALLLYLIGLFVRLEGIGGVSPGPDERHWLSRSRRVVAKLTNGDYSSATTHLGHPGLPPSLAIAASQYFAKKWNGHYSLNQGDRLYLDRLIAARVAIALLASLIFPLIFFAAQYLFGIEIAALATLLLIFDPLHIHLSHVAHIDSSLVVFGAACAISFMAGEWQQRLAFKLLAGVFWGLAIAVKPTAVALLPALFGIRMISILRRRCQGEHTESFVSWSDFWTVIVGHLTLAAIWTKLSDPRHNFIKFHHVNPKICKQIGNLGEFLQLHSSLIALTVLLTLAAAAVIFRSRTNNLRRIYYHLSMIFLIAGLLLLLISSAPLLLQNTIRFWGWVFGLSKETHKAYGTAQSMDRIGYLEIWLRRLPSMIIIGWIIGLFALALRRIRESLSAKQLEGLILALLIPISFTLLLGISSKQAIRYVLPAFPAVYLFAAWGIWQGCTALAIGLQRVSTTFSRRALVSCAAAAIVLLQTSFTYSWRPHFDLFFNSLTGGISTAVARGFSIDPSGYEEALAIIQAEADSTGKKQRVSIGGDRELMIFSYRRMFGDEASSLDFFTLHSGYSSDWLIEFPAFEDDREQIPGYCGRLSLVSRLEVRGQRVYSLYRIGPSHYDEPFVIPLSHGFHTAGQGYVDAHNHEFREAVPGRDHPGSLHFGQSFHPSPGTYRVRFELLLLDDKLPEANIEKTLVELSIGNKYDKQVLARDLKPNEPVFVSIECTEQEPVNLPIEVNWKGVARVALGEIVIERVPGAQ